LLARDQGALEAVAAEIRAAGGSCAVCPCDVIDRSSVDAALAQATAALGPPTILVNNAGFGGPFQLLSDSTDADYDQVFHTNVRAAFWFCRALLPGMRAAGFGRIVNVASIEALTGASESAHYIASKHALIGYTKAIAAEWGRFGITSNAVCPGFVATEMAAGFDPAKITPRIPPVDSPIQRRSPVSSRFWPPKNRPTSTAASSPPTADCWPTWASKGKGFTPIRYNRCGEACTSSSKNSRKKFQSSRTSSVWNSPRRS
jgi:NAD(P)-dependent dehydrogenase (short-subunit alcohol dehydrogenase family)